MVKKNFLRYNGKLAVYENWSHFVMAHGIEEKNLLHNRSAFHRYVIKDTFEAGIVLEGYEAKSLRLGHGNLKGAFARAEHGEVNLEGLFIKPYTNAPKDTLKPPARKRKLLLNRRQIKKLENAANHPGSTLAITKLYTNRKGLIKAEIAIAVGKTTKDKKNDLKKRDWQCQKQRLLKKELSS